MSLPTGIHHVTAIASDPQANVDFYSGLLGLRLVKKTVNFDDPSAYHLYYGDHSGSPGTIVTFFYWPGLGSRGRVGSGQMTSISLSVPEGSLDYWQQRLTRNGVSVTRGSRLGETVLRFRDPDGIPVDLVGASDDSRTGWAEGPVEPSHAVRGLHTAELTLRSAGPTLDLLTKVMGYRLTRSDGNRQRLEAGPGGPGRQVDLVTDPTLPAGTGGVGTIHHIAWRVPDDPSEADMQALLARSGLAVSDVRDRTYFRSIYYRERAGILFEIATDIPGFAFDEAPSELGTALKLPLQFEAYREQIAQALPPLAAARKYP